MRYELNNGFGLYADVYSGNFRINLFYLNVGAYYRLNNNMQFQISYGKQYARYFDLDSKQISFGFNWLLFNK